MDVSTEQVQKKQTSTAEHLKQSHACKLKAGPKTYDRTRNAVARLNNNASHRGWDAVTQRSVDVSPQHRECLPIDSHLGDTSQPKTSDATCRKQLPMTEQGL